MASEAQRTMTLTDFLLARIAEDEEWLAQQSGDLEWCQECAFGSQPESPYSLSRLTADCEAKRRIVEDALSARFVAFDPDSTLGDKFLDEFAQGVLSLLALPYAAHPDYREEWRP